jgi:hypothetical protein
MTAAAIPDNTRSSVTRLEGDLGPEPGLLARFARQFPLSGLATRPRSRAGSPGVGRYYRSEGKIPSKYSLPALCTPSHRAGSQSSHLCGANLVPDRPEMFEREGPAIFAIVPGCLPDHPGAYPGIAEYVANCVETFYRIVSNSKTIPGVGTFTLRIRGVRYGPKARSELASPRLTSNPRGCEITAP